MSLVLERRRYELLLAAILVSVLVFPALGEAGRLAAWPGVLVFALVLASAVHAVGGLRRAQVMVVTTGIGAFVAMFMGAAIEMEALAWARHGLAALFLASLTVAVLRFVLASGRVTGERVTAAICAYLLLGMVWAQGYALLHLHDSEALRLPPGATEHVLTYFSMVTLTTLGYGDVTPVHPVARSLAFLEAATGVLYVAVLVARLVALQIVHGDADPPQSSSS